MIFLTDIPRRRRARLISLKRFTPPINPKIFRRFFVHFSQVPLSTRASLVHEVSRTSFSMFARGFQRHDIRTRSIDERSRLWRRTYQDSHFCSRDVPGASRSELDADCRRFLALYTRHTFAFATRRPVRGPKSYTPTLHLFVQLRRRRSHRPERPPLPFGTDAPLPLPHKYASCEEMLLSFFNKRVSFSSFFVRMLLLAMPDFFFSSHIFADTLSCALVSYDTFSEERRTYRSWTPLSVGSCR